MSLSMDRPVTTPLLLQCLTSIEISLANEEFKMNNINYGMQSMRNILRPTFIFIIF